MSYKEELDSIATWIKATAGLNSLQLQAAPPKVARPVILWEAPYRTKARDNSPYQYVVQVTQYGTLYAVDLAHLVELQEKLLDGAEQLLGRLPVYDAEGQQVSLLKNLTVTFDNADTLDVPFNIKYEATYGRLQPVDPGPATTIHTKVTLEEV